MKRSFLFFVEGEKTEPSLLQNILQRYCYSVIQVARQNKTGNIEFDISTLSDEKSNVIIAQASRNTLNGLYQDFQKDNLDFNKFFSNHNQGYSGIFLIYDVDHTTETALSKMTDLFNNESDGLLLVSSPCIEVLSDPNRTTPLLIKESFVEYKKERNIAISSLYGCSVFQYICDNFENLVLIFLQKNKEDFNSTNVSDHPALVVNEINAKNIRNNDGSAVFRYFTTVLYVAIAYMKGLTKEADNYETVKQFFENQLKQIKKV